MIRKVFLKQNIIIHTSITRNCMVFLLPRRQTRSAIYGLTPINGRPCCSQSKRNHAILRHICVDHCILLLKHLSNHMHFITNGYKRFSKTNSTDPRQRVPLTFHSASGILCLNIIRNDISRFQHSLKTHLFRLAYKDIKSNFLLVLDQPL